MGIRALLAIAGLLAALVQPAAAVAVGQNGAPRTGAAGGSGASATMAKVTREKPKALAARKAAAKRASNRILIYIPAAGVPTTDYGLGDVANCASYTGCTDEEYCIIWFLRCELVPPPVGSLQLQAGRLP